MNQQVIYRRWVLVNGVDESLVSPAFRTRREVIVYALENWSGVGYSWKECQRKFKSLKIRQAYVSIIAPERKLIHVDYFGKVKHVRSEVVPARGIEKSEFMKLVERCFG